MSESTGKDFKLVHDFSNYLYGQKALTEMCLELLSANELAELKTALKSLNRQQEELLEPLLVSLKKALND